MPVEIRYDDRHAVLIEYSESAQGVRLVSVAPRSGPLPLLDDILLMTFLDLSTLERVIRTRLRALSRHEPQRTFIDRILLSRNAVENWHRAVQQSIGDLRIDDPEQIPNEEAEVLNDGRLRIFVRVERQGEVMLIVPKGEWRFMDN